MNDLLDGQPQLLNHIGFHKTDFLSYTVPYRRSDIPHLINEHRYTNERHSVVHRLSCGQQTGVRYKQDAVWVSYKYKTKVNNIFTISRHKGNRNKRWLQRDLRLASVDSREGMIPENIAIQ